MNAENVEQLSLFENDVNDETTEEVKGLTEDEDFKELVYSRMRQIYNDGMVVGLQTACHTALDKIYTFERSQGKKSTNDYKRLIKDLKKFFEIGISRQANPATTAEESTEEETVQN